MSSEAKGRPRRAGLVTVARAIGVSPSTVSNAYNRPDQLSPALRERILSTAAQMGYSGPDPVARSLRSGRAGAIGIVLTERLHYAFDDPAAVRFLQGLSEPADEEQLAVVLVPGSPDRPARGQAVRDAAVDGFIVHSLPADDPLFAATLERRLPTVIVDSPVSDDLVRAGAGEPPVAGVAGSRGAADSRDVADLDFVGIDDGAAAESAVRHLLELGHRRLGIVTFRLSAQVGPGPVDARRLTEATASVPRLRLEGCASALHAAGLEWSGVEERATTSVEEGRAGAHALLDRSPGITALFAFSDPLALGAREAARERGLSVPGDLSIVGFDDTAPASEDLTSVHQPQREKGRIAAARLIRALGEDAPPPGRRLLPTRLVGRGSTAPPRS